jgi:PAS domain S-box-containing protein
MTKSWLFRYGLAVITVGLAFLVTASFSTLLSSVPFALFYVAVVVSTLYGGRGAGLLATALSALASAYLILPPSHILTTGVEATLLVGVFVFVSLVISWLMEKGKRAEVAAERSNAQLTATLMSIGDAIIATDSEGNVTFMNSVAHSLTSWTLEDARGVKFHEVVNIKDAKSPLEEVDPVKMLVSTETIEGWTDQAILIGKDERKRRIDIKGTLVKDVEGKVTGLVFTIRDITKAKAADEKIQFQAHLLDVVEQGMIATDMDGIIVYWNKFAESLYGWRAEEVIGRNVTEIVPSDVSRNQAAEIFSQLKDGASWEGEFLARHKDGTIIPIRVRDSPVYDVSGKQIGIVGSSDDITRRIRADREKARLTLAIEEQRVRLDSIVASVPGVVWEARGEPDSNSQSIDFVSEHVETMLGYSVDEWLSVPNFWLQIVHDDDKDRAGREAAANYLRGEGSSQFRWIAKDGRVVWVEAHSVAIHDDNGRAIGMRGVTMDITERKRSEEALVESEERYRAVAESATDAILVVDDKSTVLLVNPAAERIFGHTPEELVGQSLTNLMPEYLRRVHRAGLENYVETGREHISWTGVELPGLHKDGHEIPLEMSFSEFTKDGKQVFTGIVRDITERVRADETRSRLAAIVASSGDAIIGKSLDGIVTSWNNGAERIYGYTPEEAVGQSISFIVPPEKTEELPKILERIRNGLRVEQLETVRIRKDGTRIHMSVTVSPIYDAAGVVSGASTIAQDITERIMIQEKQAELLAREQAARSQAELANRTKDEFLATLSHELRTPLTAMLGWTWMLRYRTLDEETYTRAIETIDRNVHMQAHLIDDLLDVSRIITGNLRLEIKPVDLVAVVEAALDTVRPAAVAKSIQLDLDLDPTAKNIICDPARMQQVAWNLLSNAVKFTPAQGTVSVRLERVDSQIVMNVSDTGRGISPEFLPFVFDRFRQADGSTTRTHGGLGLGLAIVRHLVELHGGTVSVESDGIDKGSSFTVALPLVPRTSLPETAPGPTPGSAGILPAPTA